MSPAQVVKDWWGSTVKRNVTLYTAILIAVLTTMHFGEVLEPYWIAQKYFVREEIDRVEMAAQKRDRAITNRIISTEIATKESDLRSERRALDQIKFEMEKLPSETPQSLRDVLSDRIRRSEEAIERLKRALELLRCQKSGRASC